MSPDVIIAMFSVVQIAFAFAFGACVGSLINVLVYRMPLGLDVVRPSSRCPSCGHVLTWRENIPVLGWVLLGGKCRFCKAKISPEYPIVEAFVGFVFVAFYVLWYLDPDFLGFSLGIDWTVVRPEWAENGFAQTWPVFIALLCLVGSLIAMTIIDARTFTIPLALAWTPTIVALIAHPLGAVMTELSGRAWRYTAEGDWWALATPGPFGWQILCTSVGGVLGIAIGNVLLVTGLLRRSFEDYDEWEAKALAESQGTSNESADNPAPETPKPETPNPETPNPETSELGDAAKPISTDPVREGQHAETETGEPAEPSETPPVPFAEGVEPNPNVPPTPSTAPKLAGLGVAAAAIGAGVGTVIASLVGWSPLFGALAGLLIAIVAVGPLAQAMGKTDGPDETPEDPDETPAHLWIQYPHARREMVRELAFLAPCVVLAFVGWFVGEQIGSPWRLDPVTLTQLPARGVPHWLSVLGGVLLGYLVGGGLVWGIRIFGTLGFGKEAMGLGDVHLLAAVGATIGWIDATLAFFVAPFIAIYVVLIQATWTGGRQRAMPYGPYLAIATVVVILAKPVFEGALTTMFGSPVPLDFP